MKKVSIRSEKTGFRGRHPMLKLGSLAMDIFNLLKTRPMLTFTEIARILHQKPASVNGMLQRMKGEGLVFVSAQQRGNRVISVYSVARGNETGLPRDKVEIESEVYVNDFGEYSVRSRIVGSLPTATEDNPILCVTVRHYAAVPKPNEAYATRVVHPTNILQAPARAKKQDSLVIEGEAEDIT